MTRLQNPICFDCSVEQLHFSGYWYLFQSEHNFKLKCNIFINSIVGLMKSTNSSISCTNEILTNLKTLIPMNKVVKFWLSLEGVVNMMRYEIDLSVC